MQRHAARRLFSKICDVRACESSGHIGERQIWHASLPVATRLAVSSDSERWQWSYAASLAAFGAIAYSAILADDRQNSAQCAAEIPLPSANPKGDQFLDDFKAWLKQRRCDMAALEIRPCSQNPAAGLGVYAVDPELQNRLKQSWWKRPYYWLFGKQDAVLASFPLSSVVTARTIVQDKKLGRFYKELLDSGAVDERQLIAVFLLVERIRGADSAWHPWISMLPQSFRSPLFFGKIELDELKGTTLLRATEVLKSSLQAQWTELSPYIERLLRAGGTSVQGLSATFDDYLWAYALFWSRSIAFPEPNACPDPLSRAVKPQEGIVPGLDFCNHSVQAKARWSVWNPAGRTSEIPEAVSLLTKRTLSWKDGEEVTINYGDKSNEELLLQYGFTLTENMDDALMLVCPPSEEAPAVLGARIKLMQQAGIQPQLFLTASGLKSANSRSSKAQEKLGFSDELWQVLDILLMPPEQAVRAADQAQQASSTSSSKGTLGSSLNTAEAKALTRRKLLVVLQLLDSKIAEMEDPKRGTGSLENDIRLLEKADLGPTPTLRSCLTYRASQKRIARSYRAKIAEALREPA